MRKIKYIVLCTTHYNTSKFLVDWSVWMHCFKSLLNKYKIIKMTTKKCFEKILAKYKVINSL